MNSDETQGDASEAIPEENGAIAECMQIAGFWRRIAALAIDGTFLGVLGLTILWALGDQVAQLGAWGRMVGFLIALVYFGVLNSWLGDGQTAGKMAVGIRVVGRDGYRMTVPRSMARAAILEVPFFLNGALLPLALQEVPWSSLVALLVFGGNFAIVYLYVFNRRTRQSLHDLALGTLVVRDAPEAGQPAGLRMWRYHWIPAGIVAVGALAAPTLLGQVVASRPAYQALAQVIAAVAAEPGARYVQAKDLTVFGGGSRRRDLVVDVHVDDRRHLDQAYAQRVRDRAEGAHPDLSGVSAVVVTLWMGVDIGIASSSTSNRFRFSLQDESGQGSAEPAI